MDTTVIIPTLMKAPSHLQSNLEFLKRQNCDIHLIDNTTKNLCKKFEGTNDRLRISYFPSNMGVNPAWNLGLASCSSKYYLILNDDCLIWNQCIERSVKTFEENEDLGILTYKTLTNINSVLYYSLYTNQNLEPKLEDLGYGKTRHTIGWFMFGKVLEWHPIPKELRIFYGDNFIYQMARKDGKRTVIDTNHVVYHQESATVNSVFTNSQIHQLFQTEGKAYQSVQKKFNLEGI